MGRGPGWAVAGVNQSMAAWCVMFLLLDG